MGEPGWTQPGFVPDDRPARARGKREEIEEVLREHGIDPDQKGQTIDASKVPGLRKALLKALFRMASPNAGGIGDGIPSPEQKPPVDPDG